MSGAAGTEGALDGQGARCGNLRGPAYTGIAVDGPAILGRPGEAYDPPSFSLTGAAPGGKSGKATFKSGHRGLVWLIVALLTACRSVAVVDYHMKSNHCVTMCRLGGLASTADEV